VGALGHPTLDAGVVLGVMIFGDFASACRVLHAGSCVCWTMFLLLALTAMRPRPAVVLYFGGLLVAGLATAMALDAHQAATARQMPSAQRWD